MKLATCEYKTSTVSVLTSPSSITLQSQALKQQSGILHRKKQAYTRIDLILQCKTYHTFSVRTFYFVGKDYLIGLEDNSQ